MDELNEFYRGGFSVFDANKNEDFRLRLKLYCTVCDWPGYSHHRKFGTCTFSSVSGLCGMHGFSQHGSAHVCFRCWFTGKKFPGLKRMVYHMSFT